MFRRLLPACRVLATVCPTLALIPLAAASQIKPYGEVVTAEAETDEGLFDVHRVGDRLLFEIPDEMLARDMVVMSRLHRVQEGQTNVGANMAPNMMVRWERRGDQVLLRAPSFANTADAEDNVSIAVENASFAPVVMAFDIEARGDGSSVVDVTDLYTAETPAFSLPQSQRTRFGVRRYDRGRSWLEWARSFPINVEIRVVQTYDASQPPSSTRAGAVSFEVNHSMVLLPEEPMMPRLWDERVGFISIQRTDYSRDFDGVRPGRYAVRYRLEPSDTAAFLRGELVRPVKPWVWYIDPATPEEWVPYIEAGILEWNEGFEEAGFRNAVEVRRAPTEDEDPEFSLLDARF